MFNFLYCFEESYNTQAYCSIMSLLDHSREKVNLFILHNNVNSFNDYEQLVIKHEHLNSLEVFQFDENNINFPSNFKNSHLNVNAIYYRLFIEDYLPKNIEFILYVDSDAYFIKDYHSKLIEEIAKLEKGKRTLSAQTGHKITKVDNRLNLKSGKFLNSGILLINYKLWIKNKCTFNFSKMLNERKADFDWHDQDILSI